MKKIHEEYPDYLWKKNKGKPTKAQREDIKIKGYTPQQRKSDQLRQKQHENEKRS